MPVMRLIPQDEFYQKLAEKNLTKQEGDIPHQSRWVHQETGKSFYVPDNFDLVPEYVLSRILEAINALYDKTVCSDPLSPRLFEVTEKPGNKVIPLSRP